MLPARSEPFAVSVVSPLRGGLCPNHPGTNRRASPPPPTCRCSVCDASLATWYFEKDGILFCKADYADKFGEACQACSKVGREGEVRGRRREAPAGECLGSDGNTRLEASPDAMLSAAAAVVSLCIGAPKCKQIRD